MIYFTQAIFKFLAWFVLIFLFGLLFSHLAEELVLGFETSLIPEEFLGMLAQVDNVVVGLTFLPSQMVTVIVTYLMIAIILAISHVLYFETLTFNMHVNFLTLVFHSVLWILAPMYHAFFYARYYRKFLSQVGQFNAYRVYLDGLFILFGPPVIALLTLAIAELRPFILATFAS